MKLESKIMCDKSVSNQNDDSVLSDIENGKVYREDTEHIYNLTGDVTDACIDAYRYATSCEIRRSLSEKVITLINGKDNLKDKLKIAKLDKDNVIAAYLATYQYYSTDDISNLLMSEDEYLAAVGVGLSVIYDSPLILPQSNILGLYKYFRSREITETELEHFTSDEFIEYSFRMMLKEERVIFTWMINNLISLLKMDVISIDKHSEFFIKLLKDNDYLHEIHMSLFLLVLKRKPCFIKNIVELKLCIDPFTKQYNYSKWLKDIKKFDFISSLKDSISEEYRSKELDSFDRKKSELYRINKNDHSFTM